jgi:hypothetical protein
MRYNTYHGNGIRERVGSRHIPSPDEPDVLRQEIDRRKRALATPVELVPPPADERDGIYGWVTGRCRYCHADVLELRTSTPHKKF